MSEKINPTSNEAVIESHELPSRDEAIDQLRNKITDIKERINLAKSKVERPGVTASADDIIANRAALNELEEAEGKELSECLRLWDECGGSDVDSAQARLDSLDFNSDANERLQAQLELRDAKNNFYDKLTAALATSEGVGDIDTEATQEINTIPAFKVGDTVRVLRTKGDVEDNWTVIKVIQSEDTFKYTVEGIRFVNKFGNVPLHKTIGEKELVEMQSMDITDKDQPEANDSSAKNNVDVVPEGQFNDESDDATESEDSIGFIDKIKESPTKLYLRIKNKLKEMSDSWKELPEKDKKRYKIIGGIAVGAIVVAGAYMAMKGYDSNGIDQSAGVDSSAGPDAGATPSAESNNSSAMPESSQPTAEPTPSESATASQPSAEASSAANGPDASSSATPEAADNSAIDTNAAPTSLTGAQEKFANSTAQYPWQAAYDAYGDKAGSALQQAVKLAQESGLDVQTFGEGQNWSIKVNGSWNSQEVVKALAEFMPKK